MRWVFMICIWCAILAAPAFAQTERPPTGKARRLFVQPGINLNYPLHDDMIRTHRLGAGLSFLAAWRITRHYDIGIRAGFDYHWPRLNFPDSSGVSDTSKLPYSVLAIQCANIFHLRKGWITGLDMGYGLPDTKGSHGGLGWIQEYDGVVRNYLATSLYGGKEFGRSLKHPMVLTLVLQNLFGESHAENSVQVRFEIQL